MANETSPVVAEQPPAQTTPQTLDEKAGAVQVAEIPAATTTAPAEEKKADAPTEKCDGAADQLKADVKAVEAKVADLSVDETKKEEPKTETTETKTAETPVDEKMHATLSGPAPAEPVAIVDDENPIIKAAREKEKQTGKRYTIFEAPTPDSRPDPLPELSEAEKEKYAKVLAHFEKLEAVPVSTEKNAPVQPLEDHERMWLTKECFERYLRAAKWDVNEAIRRVEATLVWRREYGTDRLTAQHIEPEQVTGKQWTVYYDKQGRPCHVLNPSRQNTDRSDRQVEHLIFMLERDIDLMPPGQSTIALLCNFGQTSREHRTPLSMAKQILNILQNHYPERLGKALVIEVPWFINAFFKLVTPFIDPITRQKLAFNEDLTKFVPAEQLDKAFGGQVDFEYDHAVFWTHYNELAGKRRSEYTARWIARGKKIGDSEFVLKGGVVEEGKTA